MIRSLSLAFFFFALVVVIFAISILNIVIIVLVIVLLVFGGAQASLAVTSYVKSPVEPAPNARGVSGAGRGSSKCARP